MQSFVVFIRLGQTEEELIVTAENELKAIAKAKLVVAAHAEWSTFRHRYTNYSV